MARTLHMFIEGRVQGVGYRHWFARQAQTMGLTGWVRNRTDGRVEATVSGGDIEIERMIAAARRGPQLAVVSRITCEDLPAEEFARFAILQTV